MSMRLMAASIVVSAIGLLSGCSTSELMNSAKSPEFNRAPFKKVMVIGVAKRPEVRRMYEDDFVQKLKAAGVEGVTSYGLIPDLEKATRDDVKRVAGQTGVDAVLVTRLVKFDSKTYTFPSNERAKMLYGTDWSGTYTPAQDYVAETVVIESQLFDAASAKAVWSGTTQSFDPNQNLNRSVSDLAGLIAKALAAQKLI
jgi:hypothetical protein